MVRRVRRLRIDPRAVVGACIVAASVAGVVTLVGSLERTVLVYAAARPLSVGDRLDAADLVLAEVRLGSSESRYLRAEEPPPEGAVAVRAIGTGELVPGAAVGQAVVADVASVTVTSAVPLPRSVGTGSVVDVWTSPRGDLGGYGPPRIIAAGAGVADVVAADALSAGARTTVELLVDRDSVAEVLSAVANDEPITLVPDGATARR